MVWSNGSASVDLSWSEYQGHPWEMLDAIQGLAPSIEASSSAHCLWAVRFLNLSCIWPWVVQKMPSHVRHDIPLCRRFFAKDTSLMICSMHFTAALPASNLCLAFCQLPCLPASPWSLAIFYPTPMTQYTLQQQACSSCSSEQDEYISCYSSGAYYYKV